MPPRRDCSTSDTAAFAEYGTALKRLKIEKPAMPKFTDMTSWTERVGHSRLRTFTDKNNRVWSEQNEAKQSRWTKLARDGHALAWYFDGPGVFLHRSSFDRWGDLHDRESDQKVLKTIGNSTK